MAEYFVGPVMEKIMEKLIDVCFEYLKDQGRWQTGMKEELQKLQDIHPQIQATISAYSQLDIKDPALNKWYWQLRDAIDEADDVLDEFEYRMKREKADFLERAIEIGKRAIKIDPCLKRLEEVVHKLSNISAQVSNFHNCLEDAKQKLKEEHLELIKTRETGSTPPANDFLGRSNDMEFVKNWLTATTNTNISVLSVVGHGGMGKTTLLQHVYKDVTLNKDEMMEGFDVKMWVCVSTNFDVSMVIKNILESLKKERSNLETYEALQSCLQSEVRSKRFLLVLDDIWEDDEPKWEKVLAPLHHGSLGSKILVTTRMDSVALMFAKMIKNNQKWMLEGLEKDECLRLFNMHAFASKENTPDDEFRSIAEKMVDKFSGCPLATKVIGGILNSYVDKSYWLKVLNTNIGNIGSYQNHLLPILKLSYIYLPKSLQSCFVFSCMFPQDYEFDRDDLVRMWVALGFIQSSDIQGETLEDTGRRYFNNLVQKSFFDEFHTYDDKVCYKMHDLLHELAKSISTQEYFRFLDYEEPSIHMSILYPETIRHLSIYTKSPKEVVKKMGKLKKLRSLFLYSEDTFDQNVISKILKACKTIRLLVISSFYMPRMPKTVGSLIHLRYLKVICKVGSLNLPRCVSHLYNLQFIICSSIRNLKIDKIGWKELMPNENCQLITDGVAIKDPSLLQIEPLRINWSFRSLRIEENKLLVSFSSETEQWFLQHRSSLIQLEFEKLRSLQSLPYSLESLSSLKQLLVYDVPQLKQLPNLPASLTTLLLENLKSFQCLTSCLSTSSLRTVVLYKIPLLKSLPDFPSSLTDLRFMTLESLECLPSSLSAISSLEDLTIRNIPLLKSLPDFPSSLKYLEIHCLKSLKCLPSSLSGNSSLETLELRNMPLLKSLPDLPPSLTKLDLTNLSNLDCLPSCLPTALNTLKINAAPRLLELPHLPSSLNVLSIKHCQSQLWKRYQNFDRR